MVQHKLAGHEDVELIVLGSFVMLILVSLCRLLLCELVVSLLRETFGILKIVEHSWFRSSLRFFGVLGFSPHGKLLDDGCL